MVKALEHVSLLAALGAHVIAARPVAVQALAAPSRAKRQQAAAQQSAAEPHAAVPAHSLGTPPRAPLASPLSTLWLTLPLLAAFLLHKLHAALTSKRCVCALAGSHLLAGSAPRPCAELLPARLSVFRAPSTFSPSSRLTLARPPACSAPAQQQLARGSDPAAAARLLRLEALAQQQQQGLDVLGKQAEKLRARMRLLSHDLTTPLKQVGTLRSACGGKQGRRMRNVRGGCG